MAAAAPNPWTLPQPGMPAKTFVDMLIQRNGWRLAKDNYNFTHLLLNGGKIAVPYERRRELFNMCMMDVQSNNYNFLVEMPFAPDCDRLDACMRLVMDLDVDSPDGEVMDDEWLVIMGAIQQVMGEVYGDVLDVYKRRMVVLNAGPKQRRKDGVDGVKTGRHCVFPDIYVTQATAVQLRDLIIYRISQKQTLADCPKLRAERIESIIDKSIYENGSSGKMNGFRMPLMHKAHGCSRCTRMRKAKNRLNMEKWLIDKEAGVCGDEAKPVETYFHFDDCDKCFGRSYVYEGRPYSAYAVLDGESKPMPDELRKLRDDICMLLEQTCVRLPDDAVATKCAPVLDALTVKPAHLGGGGRGGKGRKRKAAGGVGAGNAKGGGGGDGKWSQQPTQTPAADALDRFIFENFRDKTMDDEKIPELLRSDPHGISKWIRSDDGQTYVATSISKLCKNKAQAQPEEPMHSRSQVYFVISSDGKVVQRCHADKTYNGQPCKQYRSPAKFLPPAIMQLLWPPEPQVVEDDRLVAIAAEHPKMSPHMLKVSPASSSVGDGSGATLQTLLTRAAAPLLACN